MIELTDFSGASAAAQDYLKHIYVAESERDRAVEAGGGDSGGGAREAPPPREREGLVSTKDLARRLDVSAASATNMLKRLHNLGLVKHVPYQGAALTDAGRKIALEVIRHHRLLETYLAEALGVSWDRVHEEAEVLEHFLSDHLEDRIAALLGNPTEDPHGHPIPARDLGSPTLPACRLSDLQPQDVALIAEVSDRDSALLRYLADLGLFPGVCVRVVQVGPFGGAITLAIGGSDEPDTTAAAREVSVGVEAADQVFVERRSERAGP
jgi:DtxR family transcriptional regulator, Mn-dependent transcriptional regulator